MFLCGFNTSSILIRTHMSLKQIGNGLICYKEKEFSLKSSLRTKHEFFWYHSMRRNTTEIFLLDL